MGLLLFILYVNGLNDRIHGFVAKTAYDKKLGGGAATVEEAGILQKDKVPDEI